jgi:hypothetical protein
MSTFEDRRTDMTALLEAEVARFRRRFPRSAVRFAEIVGKRVSHVAGPVDALHIGERRVPVNDRVLMLVDDRDSISEGDLGRFASRVATVLAEGSRRSSR